MRLNRTIPFLILGLISAASAFSQNGDAQGTPVFKAQSRLVVIDVVVHDKNGHIVVGLQPKDFLIMENGEPQKIAFFEDHTSARPRPTGPKPQLPPNQYTNYPTEPPKDTLNIVLFDLVNTPTRDQIYARKEMLKALENLPKGHQMALFILGTRLQMVQGPSGDSAALVEAAKTVLATPARMVKDNTQISAENSDLLTLQQMAGGNAHGTPSPVDEQLRVALMREEGIMTNTRVDFTLSSMEAIARIVAGYPGRKNLIWVTAGIPFQIGPDMKADKYHRWRERKQYLSVLERAEALLADAQIAIYPVDVAGLAVLGVDASVSGKTFSASGAEYVGALNDQSDAQWNNRLAMTNLAEQTGGKAFFGTNDLAGAITGGIEQGSRYYSIAYVPRSHPKDGTYRSIKVDSIHGDLDLKYRKGYIAGSMATPSVSEASQMLAAQMQIGVPASTALLMKVQVLPPDSEHPNVRVDYAFAPDDIRFAESADHRQKATLDLMAVAWNDKGQPALSTSNVEEVAFQKGTPQQNFETGVPGRQEFKLGPGKYVLCLGAMDRATQRIGTVWVPLTIGENK